VDHVRPSSGEGSRQAVVSDVMDALGDAFPWELAGEGDGSGLLLGTLQAPVSRVLCSVELTSESVEAAAASRCEVLVVHHPHMLSRAKAPLDAGTPGGRLARKAADAGLNIIACYSPADLAAGGAADLMARTLGMSGARPLVPSTRAFIGRVVVFVPPDAVGRVSSAMAGAGAGIIGDYTQCFFESSGAGTFLPGEGAKPHAGVAGRLDRVDEVRLETVCPSFRLGRVTAAMIEAHPYEEVAYDVYRTESDVPWGSGRIGELTRERTPVDLLEAMAAWCGSQDAVLVGEPDRAVTRVAVAPGPCDKLIEQAWRQGAEVLIAGEAGWHATVEACEVGLALITLGHLESERELVPVFRDVIRLASAAVGWGMEVEGYQDQGGRWG